MKIDVFPRSAPPPLSLSPRHGRDRSLVRGGGVPEDVDGLGLGLLAEGGLVGAAEVVLVDLNRVVLLDALLHVLARSKVLAFVNIVDLNDIVDDRVDDDVDDDVND